MNCATHPEQPAVTTCGKCKRPLCESCTIHWRSGVICKHCLEADQLKDSKQSFRKSPGLAAFLSLMPGMGQIYVGHLRSGFINIMVVAAIITMLGATNSHSSVGAGPFLGLFLSFFWIFNMFDAANKARAYNRQVSGMETLESPTDSPLVGGIVLLVLGAFLTLTITFDLDLEFIEPLWPVAILLIGVYMIMKYRKTKDKLADKSQHPKRIDDGFGEQ